MVKAFSDIEQGSGIGFAIMLGMRDGDASLSHPLQAVPQQNPAQALTLKIRMDSYGFDLSLIAQLPAQAKGDQFSVASSNDEIVV